MKEPKLILICRIFWNKPDRNLEFVKDINKSTYELWNEIASDKLGMENSYGTAAFSKPETKSIKWVMGTYAMAPWYAGLHLTVGFILHNWANDPIQSEYLYMNFMNSSYGGVRSDLNDFPGSGNAHGEHMPTATKAGSIAAAMGIERVMTAESSRTYVSLPSADYIPLRGQATTTHVVSTSLIHK